MESQFNRSIYRVVQKFPMAKDKKVSKSNATPEAGKEEKIPVRQQLFGNWTGKLPVNLLHEHLQREKWEKPNYHFDQKPKGIRCSVTLGKRNKKTGSVETINYSSGEYFESQQLAKHSTATYALHRLCSNLSLHTLLPPSQKQLWQKYDQWKHDMDPDTVAMEYASDPFLAREQKAVELEKKVEEPWARYPSIHIPKEQREELESLIRSNIDHVMVQQTESNDKEYIEKVLLKKGFRLAHIKEALLYQSSVQTVMDWLCIHVPEDDLPPDMRLADKKSIIMTSHTSESLSRQFMIDRLSRSGYTRTLCESHLDSCGGKEYWAMISIGMDLAGMEFREFMNPNVDEVEQILLEEKEVVESIYADQFRMESDAEGYRFFIELEVTGEVEIHIPRNANYPHVIPGIVIGNPKLPAYIRLSILRKVIQTSATFMGAPMLFSIISEIEQCAPEIIDSPPPLLSLFTPAVGMEFKELRISSKKSTSNSVKSTKHSKEENKRLLKDYLDQVSTASYQKMLALRKKLPSFSFKQKIIHLLNDNRALIVCGETGIID
jgi:ATP-dependent RNA helicase DHX57